MLNNVNINNLSIQLTAFTLLGATKEPAMKKKNGATPPEINQPSQVGKKVIFVKNFKINSPSNDERKATGIKNTHLKTVTVDFIIRLNSVL